MGSPLLQCAHRYPGTARKPEDSVSLAAVADPSSQEEGVRQMLVLISDGYLSGLQAQAEMSELLEELYYEGLK
jgi:hypothetical protein